MSAPQVFQWDGEVMRPMRPKLADQSFVVGERYTLDVFQPRSMASHNHYFATLAELWRNLPEDQAERFPTDEAFRKHCLIMTGYRDEQTFVASSKAEAIRLAAFLRPIDDTAVVVVKDCVVRRWTAKSQSMRAMGAKEFRQSKDDVLAYAAGLVGVSCPC